jgi:hypothetical protein
MQCPSRPSCEKSKQKYREHLETVDATDKPNVSKEGNVNVESNSELYGRTNCDLLIVAHLDHPKILDCGVQMMRKGAICRRFEKLLSNKSTQANWISDDHYGNLMPPSAFLPTYCRNLLGVRGLVRRFDKFGDDPRCIARVSQGMFWT